MDKSFDITEIIEAIERHGLIPIILVRTRKFML